MISKVGLQVSSHSDIMTSKQTACTTQGKHVSFYQLSQNSGSHKRDLFKKSNNSFWHPYPCLIMENQLYLPRHIAHSTSGCGDWSSSAPPGKKQLSRSYWNSTESSGEFTVVNMLSFINYHLRACSICLVIKAIFHCKNFQNGCFIYRIISKGIQSRQPVKMRPVVRWTFSLWGHRGSIASVPVFLAFNA